MRKAAVLLAMICMVFLNGCSEKKNTENNVSKAQLEEYETYYNAILDNPVFAGESENYDLSFEMNKVPDGSYRYYTILDNERTAMYDVVMVIVENDQKYGSQNKMMPSSGVFEDPVSLIPGQVNKKSGYAKGIVLSGQTDQAKIDLKILVEWNNKDHNRKNREFLSFHLTPEGAVHQN